MDENLRRAIEAYDSRGYELVLLTPESQALVRNSEESVLLDPNGNVTAIPTLRADNRGNGKDKVAGRRGVTEVTGLSVAMLIGLVLGLAIASLAGKSGAPSAWTGHAPTPFVPLDVAPSPVGPAPTDERIRLFVYGGGATADLVDTSDCDRGSPVFWATSNEGRFIAYAAGATARARAAWHAHFHGGIPPGTPLLGTCR